MNARTESNLSDDRKRPFPVAPVLALAALVGLAAVLARADDMIAGNLGAMFVLLGATAVVTVSALLAFTGATCLLEAYIMNLFLKLGFRWCLWCAVIANLTSIGLGLIWYFAGGQVGWKTALIHGETGRVMLLLARSFVITIAEETVVVALMLRKQRDFPTALKAVVAMNAVSYALVAALTALLGLSVP
jgi:hypothetical protein